MRLKKGLGLLAVFCIASGAMISSGLFVLPGLAHAKAGPAVVVSYFLAGLLALTGLLSIAELATAMPRAGGDYFFVARGMGPAVGTVAGMLTWFSLTLKSAFALVGMGAFARLVMPVDTRLVGLILCAIFVGINLVGAKEAARLQIVLVLALMALMLLYVAKGLPHVDIAHFQPFLPKGGMRAVLATVGFVFVSYGGLLKIASVSEEIRNPGRVIPLGMILSLLVVSILYTLMVFVTSGVLTADKLNTSQTPISDGAAAFLGRPGYIALSIAAVLAFVSTANAGVMAASRYLLAISRDQLLPPSIGRVSRRFGTPYVAILITGALMAASLLVRLDVLVKAASTVLIMTYILSNLSVIVLRESRLQNYRPLFRTPLYPWVQIIGIVGLAFVILEMGGTSFVTSAVLILIAFAIYWFYGMAKKKRESALLHLVQRITAKELVTGTLEAELKEIIRERDEIVEDRFDRIIEKCLVLDVGEAIEADAFFKQVAEKLADRMGTSAPALLEAFVAREKESTTVLRPGLAVPHIVIPGEKTFDILLARCRAGIGFGGDTPPVHAAFVLVGAKDERNFHLRALSDIAQIVSESHFEKRWATARGDQALRDIVLLGKRRRSADAQKAPR